MKILIAEDERITRTTLMRQLENWGHTVIAAEDGQQAWDLYQESANFDIVLTDWEMPRLSGVDLIQRIRQSPDAPYVYLILLTSRSDKSDVVRGMEAGADDFVSKPFDREELRVRILAGVRIVSLERTLHRQNAELRDANEHIRGGLRAAARVQHSLLPQRNIITPRVSTAWKYVPTEELAGDAIGLHLVDNRYLVAYVIDVSGHGVPAALLSVTAMHAMEPLTGAASLLRDMAATSGLGTLQRPGHVAAELNRRFRSADHDGRYMTMILAILDCDTGRLHLSIAGHPPPIILRGREPIQVADVGGFPIAIVDEADYNDAVVQLEPGDRVFLLSDGILEQTPPASSHQFGLEHLLPLLQSRHASSLDSIVTDSIQSLTTFAQSPSFTDDVSLVAVEWLGRP